MSRIFTIVAAIAVTLPLAASAKDITIPFGNNSWDPIAGFSWRVAGTEDWTVVELPNGELGSGDFLDLALSAPGDECLFDFQITKPDGSIQDRPAVDPCVDTYYFFADE